MKTISRDAIQRMTGSGSGGVSVGGGGGASIDLTGYATEMWTEENYVGKEFFSSLFKAYDSNGNEVLPNDTDTQIDNIKAMFGFWTDFYISALGTGGQSTVGLRLSQLADVNVAGVQNDQVLKYDATSQKWVPGTASSGTDMATVWSNLATSGNQQINYSHLSVAISLSNGTITIGSNSITPITSHQSLAGYAKELWVGQNYLPLTGGEVTGTLVLSKTQDASSTADSGPALVVGGTRSQAHIEIDNNEIIAKSGATGVTTLNLNDNGGPIWVAGDILMNNNARIYNYAQGSGGSLYIGRSDDAGWVKISDMCSRQGDSYWKIYSSGGAYFSQYVTALSDARHKDIQGDVALTVEMVAKAPAVKFTWKDEKKPGLFVGSLAQYWQKALPEVVQDHDGILSLDYQVTALMAAIVTARKVENHESRLCRIERMLSINEYDLEV